MRKYQTLVFLAVIISLAFFSLNCGGSTGGGKTIYVQPSTGTGTDSGAGTGVNTGTGTGTDSGTGTGTNSGTGTGTDTGTGTGTDTGTGTGTDTGTGTGTVQINVTVGPDTPAGDYYTVPQDGRYYPASVMQFILEAVGSDRQILEITFEDIGNGNMSLDDGMDAIIYEDNGTNPGFADDDDTKLSDRYRIDGDSRTVTVTFTSEETISPGTPRTFLISYAVKHHNYEDWSTYYYQATIPLRSNPTLSSDSGDDPTGGVLGFKPKP